MQREGDSFGDLSYFVSYDVVLKPTVLITVARNEILVMIKHSFHYSLFTMLETASYRFHAYASIAHTFKSWRSGST